MITIETHYLGNLRTESTHVRSGIKLITDAPVDNNGKGESFSPTDLLATALGTCMLTLMGIAAEKNGINMTHTRIEVIKLMNIKPRKVSGIKIRFFMPEIIYTVEQKNILETAALTCPVALSVHPELVQDIEFIYFEK